VLVGAFLSVVLVRQVHDPEARGAQVEPAIGS
jgi:hypothetical protein